MPGGVRAVEVPLFRNATTETGAEALFASAFRDQLALEGLLARGTADAKADGEVISIRAGPSVVYPVDGGFALGTLRVEATVRVKLLRGNETLAMTEVSGSEDYARGVGGDILGSEAGRRAAIHRLAGTMMRDAFHRLSTNF